MTGRYLTQTVSGTNAGQSNSNVTVSTGPSAGEFWAVSMVRVSTQPFTQPGALISPILAPHCTLYYGPSNLVGATTQVDDTYLGNGDVTTILSGVVIQYGERITAQWVPADGLLSFQNATMTVYGRAFSSLQELQDSVSPVPGARFSGSSANALVWDWAGYNGGAASTITNGMSIFTVTGQPLTEIVHVQFQISTDATVGNRYVGVAATIGNVPAQDGTSGSKNIFRVHSDIAQPASVVWTYAFTAGGPSYKTVPLAVGQLLPARPILNSGGGMSLLYPGTLGAGDLIQNLVITYKQYRSAAKAGYLI